MHFSPLIKAVTTHNRKDFFRNLIRYFKHPNVKLEKRHPKKGPDLGLTGTSLSEADIWSDTNLISASREKRPKGHSSKNYNTEKEKAN